MLKINKQVKEAVDHIRNTYSGQPRVGMICGTGLSGLTDQIKSKITLPYEEIPNFPKSTVESHKGNLTFGDLNGVPIVAMEGRFHYYEGYSMQQVTFPVRVMKELGIEILIVTNAAGGMNPQMNLADLVIIEDHINMMPDNPLRGINDDVLGPRFPDMCAPYAPDLVEIARKTALEMGIPAHKGVFVSVSGPNLETRAEYRMLRGMGADVVGMSTVPEVIVAAHAGLKTLGFSIVTDLCLPDALEPANIESIIAIAETGGERLARLIPKILDQLDVSAKD